MDKIKEAYSKYKYPLPKYDAINNEFDISTIENDNFLLRKIIQEMFERIDFYATTLSELLQPDTAQVKSMHESRFFNDKEREKIFELYKKLMIIIRNASEVSLQREERLEAEYIKNTFDEWLLIKPELLKIVNKMKDSWKKETDIKEELAYFG